MNGASDSWLNRINSVLAIIALLTGALMFVRSNDLARIADSTEEIKKEIKELKEGQKASDQQMILFRETQIDHAGRIKRLEDIELGVPGSRRQ